MEDLNLWNFDSAMRRCTEKLFGYASNPQLAARRVVYRRALLDIAAGLAEENPLAIGIAGEMIHDQFRRIQSMDEYHDPSRGHEVQEDDNPALQTPEKS